MSEKERLDTEIVKRGLSESRQKAANAIAEGRVRVNGNSVNKSSFKVSEADKIEVEKGLSDEFVSRGGQKLKKALSVFNIDVINLDCLDIGSSTGGFTDCLLKNGANRVIAVDVGSNQLHPSLRGDDRVFVYENTDIRNTTADNLPFKVRFISCDVSFISLVLILSTVYNLLEDKGQAVLLIKPQFEAGRANIGKNGIVKDKKVHTEIILKIYARAKDEGFTVSGLDFSPISGGDGNIEYLIHLKKDKDAQEIPDIKSKARQTVESAHTYLKQSE